MESEAKQTQNQLRCIVTTDHDLTDYSDR